jgi:hypothetical protein
MEVEILVVKAISGVFTANKFAGEKHLQRQK